MLLWKLGRVAVVWDSSVKVQICAFSRKLYQQIVTSNVQLTQTVVHQFNLRSNINYVPGWGRLNGPSLI